MRYPSICFFFILISTPISVRALDESVEPSQEFQLAISGKDYSISPDKDLSIKGTLTDPTFRLTVGTKRRFTYGGLSFEYPSYFTWEADFTTKGVKQWTLSGNSFEIMLFRYDNNVTLENYVKLTSESYKKTNPVNIKDVRENLGGAEVQGKAIVVTFGSETKVVQEIFSLQSAKGSKILVLQDSFSGEGKHSSEFEKWIRPFGETFRNMN